MSLSGFAAREIAAVYGKHAPSEKGEFISLCSQPIFQIRSANGGEQTAPSSKGNLSELKVMVAYAQAGFIVFFPFAEPRLTDLILYRRAIAEGAGEDGRLRNGCVLFAAQRIRGYRGTNVYKYMTASLTSLPSIARTTIKIYILPMLGD